MAELNPQPLPPRRSINIKLSHNVTAEQINAIVSKIGGMTGCRTCGLMGVDLRLSGDPVERQELVNLPGVDSVEIGG